MGEPKFAPLHCHTEFSILDGSFTTKDWIDRIKHVGVTSFAITDHGNMGGALEYYMEAQENGLNFIPGMEAYWVKDHRQHTAKSRKANHLLLLARNKKGFENLIRLNRVAWTDGFYYSPRIDFDVLEAHKDGLLVSTACLKGPIGSKLLEERADEDEIIRTFRKWHKVFKENFYLELMLNDMSEQRRLNKRLLWLAEEFNVPYIITPDCHYPHPGGHEIQRLLIKITHEDFEFDTNDLWLKSYKEIVQAWEQNHSDYMSRKQLEQALHTTLDIADRCKVKIPIGKLIEEARRIRKTYD